MWIELLKPVGEMKPGFHDIADEPTARAYIAAGLANDAGDGPDKIILQRSMEHLRAELSGFTRGVAAEIEASVKGLGEQRRVRIEAGEQEADRTRSLGDQVRQIVFASDHRNPELATVALERLTKVYGCKRGQAEGTGATGGFVTQAIYEAQLLEEAAEEAVFVSRARKVALGAKKTYWPALDQYKVPSAGQSAFFGGVQVYRKNENVQRTYTQAGFKQIGLEAHDLTAFITLSRDEVYDATLPIDSKVTELGGGAIGWREEWEALNGTGSGQLLGIYNAPSSLLVARTTGGTIKAADVFTMRSRLLPMSKKNACWLIHPYTMPVLEQIQDPSGRYLMRPYPIAGNASLEGGPCFQMEGIPIVETEKAPMAGSVGDLTLTDATRYLLGRRSGLEIGVSDQFLFDTDQIAIRFKLRNDGMPQLIKPITLADGSAQVSVNVVLQ